MHLAKQNSEIATELYQWSGYDVFYIYFRIMWAAGAVAAMGSLTYPAISAFVSAHAEADQQGRWF